MIRGAKEIVRRAWLETEIAPACPRRKCGRPRIPITTISEETRRQIQEQRPALVAALRQQVFAPQRHGEATEAEEALRRICLGLGFTPARAREAVKKYRECLGRRTLPRRGPGYLADLLLSRKFAVAMTRIPRLRKKTPTNNSAEISVGERLDKVEPDDD